MKLTRHLFVWGAALGIVAAFCVGNAYSNSTSTPPVNARPIAKVIPPVNPDNWRIYSDFDLDGRYRIYANRVCHNNVVYLLVIGGSAMSVTPELSETGKPNTCLQVN